MLSDGYVLLTRMGEDQVERYFSYAVADRKKDVEVNCNAPDGIITLYVNVKNGTFPTEDKHDYKSTTGLIFIPAADLADSKSNILIVLKRNPTKN